MSKSLAILLFVCLGAGTLRADWYVAMAADGGSDDNAGTEAQPFLTLTNALAHAGAGGTIYVKAGTYPIPVGETITYGGVTDYRAPSFNLTNAVSIIGVGGRENVIFDGENANDRNAFRLNHAQARLISVTVQRINTSVNYQLQESAAIELKQGLVSNCVVKSCSLYYVGAIGLRYGTVADCLVSGCSLRDSNSMGAGINHSQGGSPSVITNCVIENCSAYHGAGIYAPNAVSIYGCVIRGCSTDYGSRGNNGALYLGNASAIASNCIISNNHGRVGAGVDIRGGTLRNSLVADNVQSYAVDSGGGGVYISSGTLDSCTVVGNRSVRNVGHGVQQVNGKIVNCIINCNSETKEANDANNHTYAEGADITYTCTYPSPGGTNIGQNPCFVSVEPGDYNLADSSPCFDIGLYASWMAGAKDVYGHDRVLNDTVNMGAIETPTPAERPFTASLSADVRSGPAPVDVTFSATLNNPPAGTPVYAWDFGDGTTSDEAAPTHRYATPGTYDVSLSVTCGAKTTPTDLQADYIVIGTDVAWVSDGTGEWPYETRAKGTNDLSVAYAALMDDSAGVRALRLNVAAGEHFASAQVVCKDRKLSIVGEPGAVVKGVKDQNYPYGLLNVSGDEFSMSDLTIQDVSAVINQSVSFGAAVTLGKGVVSNCTLKSCTMPNGNYITGALHITGAGRFTHGTICGCSAYDGGNGGGGRAAAVLDAGVMEHTVISNNTATCGIVQTSGGVVSNCLIVGNTINASGSAPRGIIYVNGSSGAVDNCVVTGNVCQADVSTVSFGWHSSRIRNALVAANRGKTLSGIGPSTDGSRPASVSTFCIQNCTITANTASQTAGIGSSDTIPMSVENTIVYGNNAPTERSYGALTVESGCFYTDPRFLNAAAGDWHLRRLSPAGGTGVAASWMDSATDLDGAARLRKDGRVSPGCYEPPPRRGLVLFLK